MISQDDNELTCCHLLQAQPKEDINKKKQQQMIMNLGFSMFSTQPKYIYIYI
jgi:hypothetical protein